MKSTEPQDQELTHLRRNVALLLAIPICATCVFLGILGGSAVAILIQSGPENVIPMLSTIPNSFGKVFAMIGFLFGFVSSYWLWKQAMLRTGFLSPAQFEELYKSE